MTQLDNVKNIALEIQPCVVSPGSAGIATASAAIAAGASTVAAKSANANGAVSMNVVLRVSVKKGVDYCFVMGMDDSQLLVQSIYARLNGDSPPRIAPKSKSNGSSGGGESSSSSVAKAAKSGASGSSAVRDREDEQDNHQSDEMDKTGRNFEVIANEISDKSVSSASDGSPCSSGRNDSRDIWQPLSDKTASNQSEETILLTPRHQLQQQKQHSGLRIILSPTVTSNGSGGLVMTSVATPNKVMSLSQSDAVVEACAGGTNGHSRGEGALLAPSLVKFVTMLRHRVPDGAVRNKLVAEGGVTDENVEALILNLKNHATSISSFSSSNSVSTDSLVMPSSPPKESIHVIGGRGSNLQQHQQLGASEEASVKKYRSMTKAGVPPPAVRQKMEADGIEERLVIAVVEGAANQASIRSLSLQSSSFSITTAAAPNSSSIVLNSVEEASIKKYRSMAKAGVPLPAVRMKMASEGIMDARIVAAVCGSDTSPRGQQQFAQPAAQSSTKQQPPPPQQQQQQQHPLSAEEEQLVGKYRSMIKAGVPPQAVQNKMRAEGLVLKLITAVVGGSDENESQDGKAAGQCKGKEMGKRKKLESKLMTLHWTPLEVSEEQLGTTVWAKSQARKRGSKNDGEGSTGSCRVLSPEMHKLEQLFSKKKSGLAGAGGAGGDGKENDGKKKDTKKIKSVLENTRAQNLGIALRAFKDVHPCKGAAAGAVGGAGASGTASVAGLLACFDVDAFSVEQLTRLEEMLPTDAEVRAVSAHAKALLAAKKEKQEHEGDEAEVVGGESDDSHLRKVLTPPEFFILGFSGVARARAKLSVARLMKTFEGSAAELEENFDTVRRALGQVTGSEALAELLGEVLAVGNAMNEGTRKGDARAITMDSLLTLTKTKSHCKSRTVLDYIAETLLSNDVDQEASGDGCASSGKSKTGRETLNFVSELPDLEAASRLPIGELCTQVTQLASALQAAKHELTAVKAAQQKGQQPLGGRTTQSRAAAAAASFSSASEEAKAGDPRAALMAMIQKRSGGGATAVPAENTSEDEPKTTNPRAALMATIQKRNSGGNYLSAAIEAEGSSSSSSSSSSKRSSAGVAVADTAAVDARTAEIVASLEAFTDAAGARIGRLKATAEDVKGRAGDMAAFLGDRASDAGHIFACLKRFAGLTAEAAACHDKRIEEAARELRIALRQQQMQQQRGGENGASATAGAEGAGSSASAAARRGKLNRRASTGSIGGLAGYGQQKGEQALRGSFIDPKASLMEEVRLRFISKNEAKRAEKIARIAREAAEEDKEFEEFSATVNGLPAVVSPDSANAGVPREKVKTPAPPAPAPASCFAIETPSP